MLVIINNILLWIYAEGDAIYQFDKLALVSN